MKDSARINTDIINMVSLLATKTPETPTDTLWWLLAQSLVSAVYEVAIQLAKTREANEVTKGEAS